LNQALLSRKCRFNKDSQLDFLFLQNRFSKGNVKILTLWGERRTIFNSYIAVESHRQPGTAFE
jgi:hypothetical protein